VVIQVILRTRGLPRSSSGSWREGKQLEMIQKPKCRVYARAEWDAHDVPRDEFLRRGDLKTR